MIENTMIAGIVDNDQPQEPTPDKEEKSGGSGRWGKIFGTIFGGAASVLFPNPGTILGSVVRRSQDVQQMASFQRVIDQSAQHMWNMIRVQKVVQDQSLEVSMVSNLLKSRHDGHMAAVQNFKS